MMKTGTIVLMGALFSNTALAAPDSTTVKAGEWELHVTNSVGAPTPSVQKICYGADKPAYAAITNAMKDCSQKNFSLSGNVATIDAVCSMNGSMQVDVRGTITMIDPDNYHSDSTVRIAGMPKIKGIPDDMKVTIDARWLGPCQPGEKPL
jgi:hypothetical protein